MLLPLLLLQLCLLRPAAPEYRISKAMRVALEAEAALAAEMKEEAKLWKSKIKPQTVDPLQVGT